MSHLSYSGIVNDLNMSKTEKFNLLVKRFFLGKTMYVDEWTITHAFLRFMLIISVTITLVGMIGIHYSTGSRQGTIQKFSMKGLIVPSYEGELVQSGFRLQQSSDSNTTTINIWEFSIKKDHPDVAKQLEDAYKTGKPVNVTYDQDLARNIFKTDTNYYITKVEVLGDK